MNAVTTFLARLNVRRKIFISPLSSYNEKFYSRNLLFQCLYDQKKRSVFAAGGRYDQLIRDHQPIASRRAQIHAVGCQIAWTGLCSDIINHIKRVSKTKAKKRSQDILNTAWSSRRCDVLVRSFDQDLLDLVGTVILQELWANNISSELAERNVEGAPENPFTKNIDRNEEHSWIVLIKSEELVKVKNTIRNDEIELKTSELAGHIRGEIRERDRMEERTSKIPLPRHSSQPETNTSSGDRETDVKILMSENKGKKVNRKTIVEEGEMTPKCQRCKMQNKTNKIRPAQRHRQNFLQSCADAPIIAVETKDEIFDGIGDTRLSDPESWRKFIQSAAPGERQYLGQLQNMLRDMAEETTTTAVAQGGRRGGGTAIVYNFRTKACLLYNLGKGAS